MKEIHSPDSNHRAFHLLASYLMVVRRKVCDERRLTAEPFITFPHQTSHANCVRIVTRMCCHTFLQSRSIDKHCTRATIIVCYSQSVNQQGPSITYKTNHSSYAISAVYNLCIPSQCVSRAELHKPFPIRQSRQCSGIDKSAWFFSG